SPFSFMIRAMYSRKDSSLESDIKSLLTRMSMGIDKLAFEGRATYPADFPLAVFATAPKVSKIGATTCLFHPNRMIVSYSDITSFVALATARRTVRPSDGNTPGPSEQPGLNVRRGCRMRFYGESIISQPVGNRRTRQPGRGADSYVIVVQHLPQKL